MQNKEKIELLSCLVKIHEMREKEMIAFLSGCVKLLSKENEAADKIFERRAESLARLLEAQSIRNLHFAQELRSL